MNQLKLKVNNAQFMENEYQHNDCSYILKAHTGEYALLKKGIGDFVIVPVEKGEPDLTTRYTRHFTNENEGIQWLQQRSESLPIIIN